MNISNINLKVGSLVNIQPCVIHYENGGTRSLRDYEMREFEWTFNFIRDYVRKFENVNSIFDLHFSDGKETIGLPFKLITFMNEYYQGRVYNFCDIESIKKVDMTNLVRFCFENGIEPHELRHNMSIYSYVPKSRNYEPKVTTFNG